MKNCALSDSAADAGRADARSMKLLLTTDTIGGVWSFTRELATELCRRGHRLALLSLGGPNRLANTAWMRGLDLDYQTAPLRLEWMPQAETEAAQARAWVLDAVAGFKPDLVHTHQFAFASLAAAAPIVLTAHSDVFSWWRAVRGTAPPPSPFHDWYFQIARAGLAAADAVVTPSHAAAADLAASYGAAPWIEVIANGLNAGGLKAGIVKEPVAIAVGRVWDAAKQIALLARRDLALPVRIVGPTSPPETSPAGDKAAAEVTRDRLAVPLRHAPLPAGGPVGASAGPRSPAEGAYGASAASNLATHDRRVGSAGPKLQFLGALPPEEVWAEMARAKIFVGTSCYEPFGLAAVEAATAGCALLLNDIPSYHEVWRGAAAYFRRNDGADLARQLGDLANHEGKRQRLADAARNRALNLYPRQAMADGYERLYRRLLQGAPSAPRQGRLANAAA